MTGTTFRTVTEAPKAEEIAVPEKIDKTGVSVIDSNVVEVPYLDYEREHKIPYSAKYYGIDTTWSEREGYADEIQSIEDYFNGEVEAGRMANSIEAVQEALKKAEKVLNVTKNDRMVVRMSKMVEYLKFLDRTRDIERSAEKYGGTE